ncbi:MAG: bifunctional glutamate N-acetyltransferase/amino-acid acetyltransferase ArgJ [Lachnospiraceae bacterium]
MKKIDGGITAAKGFFAASVAAGIKYKDRMDMAMIYSDSPCHAAGTYTKNIVKAAPVVWDHKITSSDRKVQAVVINAGIANACTGDEGMHYCQLTSEETGRQLDLQKDTVLVASTGVIGKQLPIDKICAGVDAMVPILSESIAAGTSAARAIMTTDTREKEIAVTFELDGKSVTVGGMCKGSGMIHPDMCTMLGFITSDINISREMLQTALSASVEDTYNMVSVDGDTSTNDTVLLLANGKAENQEILQKDQGFDLFLEALNYVNTYLAKAIAADGEGATALFEVKVLGAATLQDARKISKAIITSSLTKAAIFGHDANWGRILCAMGYSGASFNPDQVDLFFESAAGRIVIMKEGNAIDFDEEKASLILSEPVVTAITDLHDGDFSATAWGCDLTCEYVKINADYRS